MTTAIFIMGTNATGKTALARELIKQHGGVDTTTCFCTYTKDNTAFIGDYSTDSQTFCGVDKLGSTKHLQAAVIEALSNGCELIIAEGMLVGTFGLNVQRALFLVDNPVIVCLAANAETLQERLQQRSGKVLTKKILSRQLEILKTIKKYDELGVKVFLFGENHTTDLITKFIKL